MDMRGGLVLLLLNYLGGIEVRGELSILLLILVDFPMLLRLCMRLLYGKVVMYVSIQLLVVMWTLVILY